MKTMGGVYVPSHVGAGLYDHGTAPKPHETNRNVNRIEKGRPVRPPDLPYH